MSENWMSKVNSPIHYRVGNNRINLRVNLKLIMAAFGLVLVLAILYILLTGRRNTVPNTIPQHLIGGHDQIVYKFYQDGVSRVYNSTYPIHEPLVNKASKTYQVLAIADLDTSSRRDGDKYVSYLLNGQVTISDDLSSARVEFDSQPTEISTEYAYGGRGMELSELVVFNGKLYSCDDRTGIIYEIVANKKLAIPWVVLIDGDGHSSSKGFKCEWMVVKDQKLYVGGLGKEWTTATGVFVNNNPQWVKVVGHLGDVSHLNWTDNYNKLREVVGKGYTFPGYMIFESGAWSDTEQKWYFLPRRASQEPYDEKLDEKRATNLMITSDAGFVKLFYKTIGEVNPVRGYSSFKFVPGTENKVIIALKSEEDAGQTRTYVTVFDINERILVKDTLLSDKYKFEGVEFV